MHRLERSVVVSPRHAFIRPWIRAYFASGNKIPLIIVPGPPGDWQPGDMEYCQAAAASCGGMVFDCSSEWAASRKLAERAVLKDRVGWYSKKAILHAVASRLAPKSWAWIDDDAEVTGSLDECFDKAEKASGFVYAQFYYPNAYDVRHPARMYRSKIDTGDKVCWNSLVFFHGDANKRLSEELCKDFPVEDDEIVFGHLYSTNPAWHEGFCDFSEFNWQRNCKRISQIPHPWDGKLLHYTSSAHGKEVKNMWANKANQLPSAQFELKADEDAVDAVFVIGNGSKHQNEELRYALRNLEKNCRFVRNVYICGICPSWVDKSKVRHLQWPDSFDHAKDANIIDKLRHACEMRGIAKKILFCSDDQFQTRECKLSDFAPRYLKRYSSDDKWYSQQRRVWHNRLRKTLEREVGRRRSLGLDTSKVFYYQPHIWMPIDRDLFIEYAKWSDYQHRDDTIIASGYYNFADVKGKENFDHAFLGSGSSPAVPSVTHIAYHDGSYRSAMTILKAMFPERSRFESDGLAVPVQRSVQTPNPVPANVLSGFLPTINRDASPASSSEMSEILDAMSRIRKEPTWHGLLWEVSLAEELRLFGVGGWRTVWRDIIDRWAEATGKGEHVVQVSAERSNESAAIVNAYMANPDAMRTIRYGRSSQQPRNEPAKPKKQIVVDPSREECLSKVRASLRERLK